MIKEEPDLTKVPAKVRRLLRRCLEKDPRRRLRDIGDAELLLEEVDGTGSPAQTGGLPHKSWVPWSVAGVLFLAALGLGVVVWRYNTAEPQLMRMSLQTPDKTQIGWSGRHPDDFARRSPCGIRRQTSTGRSDFGFATWMASAPGCCPAPTTPAVRSGRRTAAGSRFSPAAS